MGDANGQKSQSHLLDLPAEIVIHILSYLDLTDALNISRVNVFLRTCLQTSQVLQYRFATQVACVENNSFNNMAIHDRLHLLKRRELGWSAFLADFQVTLPVVHEPFGIYDLTGGIYLMGDVGQRALHYCKLPSTQEDPITWSRINLHESLTVVDIGLCLYEQDLIAVVATKQIPTNSFLIDVEVHLLQFSTGNPHPLAREPVLFVRKAHGPTASGVGIEIVGDYLALITTPSSTEHAARFCVFEWKTGTVMLDHPVPHNTYYSVIFLSPTHICLPNAATATLDIFDIANSKPSSAPVFFFSLPTISAGYSIRAIYSRAELNPAPNGMRHSTLPFHSASEDAIAIFNIHIRNDAGMGVLGDFSMFVHRSTLLQLCQARVADGQFLEWEAWGPPLTRWIDVSLVPWWITTTTGQRCVLSYRTEVPDSEEERPYVTLIDFNPLAVQRTMAAHKELNVDEEVVEGRPCLHLSPTEIYSNVFERYVESSLPYVSIGRYSLGGTQFNFDGVLMDEERLLGLVTDDDGRVTEARIFHIGSD